MAPDDANGEDDVKISIEESSTDHMAQASAAAPAATSNSGTSSPPVEIVSVTQDGDEEGEEGIDFDTGQPHVTILQGVPSDMVPDPTGDLPFHDAAETYGETINRLMQYFPSRKLFRTYYTTSYLKILSSRLSLPLYLPLYLPLLCLSIYSSACSQTPAQSS